MEVDESLARLASRLKVQGTAWDLSERSRVVGIVNVTPDSFSDGGLFFDAASALAHGERLASEGADILEVGGESTRPSGGVYGEGRREVSVEEEIERVVPVIRGLRRALALPIAIDTRKARVAAAALDAGASLVNDVSGGTFDPALLPLCARTRATVVLMHSRGTPETMASLASYGDVAVEVAAELQARLSAALAAGVARDRLVLDPGLGFAKTSAQSLELLANLGPLLALGCPLLVGASRKSFLAFAGDLGPQDRGVESVAAAVAAVLGGARLVRAHAVRETVRALAVADALRGAARGAAPLDPSGPPGLEG